MSLPTHYVLKMTDVKTDLAETPNKNRGLVFFAGIIVSSDDPDLLTAKSKSGKSPWTIAFTHAGVPQMGHVVSPPPPYLDTCSKRKKSASRLTSSYCNAGQRSHDHSPTILDEQRPLRRLSQSSQSRLNRPCSSLFCKNYQKRHSRLRSRLL